MWAPTVSLLLILPLALAGPLTWRDLGFSEYEPGSSECSATCTELNNFKLQIGKTYRYSYEVKSLTNIKGASEDASKVDVMAQISMHVFSKCELAMSISDVRFKKSLPNSSDMQEIDNYEFKNLLEDFPLRFSYQDGRIEELCPSDLDEPSSMNFKRGVISAFQTSMEQSEFDEDLREIDVIGNCPTKYTYQKGSRTVVITKTKDLLGCSDRHYYRTALRSTSFHHPDAIQSLPLLKGSYRCSQSVSVEGYLKETVCFETLTFRPFSKKEAGAQTETSQTLKLIDVIDATESHFTVSKKTSLIYDHIGKEEVDAQAAWSANEKLLELCRVSVHDFSAELPGLFADLVYLMRGLDKDQLMKIWDRLERRSICNDNRDRAEKFFLDALPMTGTGPAIDVMVDMLTQKKVKEPTVNVWITSLSFIQYPTASMIGDLKKLLMTNEYKKRALLPVTSLINNYCQGEPSCMKEHAVKDTLDIIKNMIGNDCRTSDQNLMLKALRASGNMGYSNQLVPVLSNCLKRRENPMTIRVAAVEAFRGVTCEADRSSLMDIFLNTRQDSELRIASYLGLMKCPHTSVLLKIKNALEQEEVNQVGSFVWTHLTNLMETSSPNKQAIREILEDYELAKEFQKDKRKFSRNYEKSFFWNKFGVGAVAESNVIFSSSSFIPRSAMLNLTVDVLGHSVNIFEVGGRLQGLETLLQHYLKPDGAMGKKEKSQSEVPSSCGKQSKMDKMKQRLSVDKDELDASVYIKLFGHELGFKHWNKEEMALIKDQIKPKDLLASLARGDIVSFTQSLMFLDSDVSVPTIAGMATRFGVNGTAVVGLKASGKMDTNRLSLKKAEMSFDLRPSGAVQLSGMMSTDAWITKSALKMKTTLHSSTAISGSIDLTNGEVLTAVVDTPKDTLEIFDVKSEFFVIHDKAEVKQKMLEDDTMEQKKCTPNLLITGVGYELCGQYSFINATGVKDAPYFPLTGPFSASVILHKMDAPRGFKFTGKTIFNKETSLAQIAFDTPGSKQDRAIGVGFFVDQKAKSAEAELTSPWQKTLVKGLYKVEPDDRTFSASVVNDGKEYKLLISTKKQREEEKTIWIPSLEISRPDLPILSKIPENIAINGKIEIDDKLRDISADASLQHSHMMNPVEVKGKYINTKIRKSLSASLTLKPEEMFAATFQVVHQISNKKAISGKIQPSILITKPSGRFFLLSGAIDFREEKFLKSNFQVDMKDYLKKPLEMNFKGYKSKKKTNDKYRFQTKMSSQFATVKSNGLYIVYPRAKKGPLISTKMITAYSIPILKNPELRKNKVTFSAKLTDRSAKVLKKYDLSMNLDSKNYPQANIVAKGDFSHKDTFSKALMTMRYGPKAKFIKDKTKEIKIVASLNHKLADKFADVRYDLQLLHPFKAIDYQVKGKHVHDTKKGLTFETYSTAIYAKGKSIELRVNGMKKNKSLLDANGLFELIFPDFEIAGTKYEGKDYRISTAVSENKKKLYTNTINVQTGNGVKHTLVTRFKKTDESYFNFYSQADLQGPYESKMTVNMDHDAKSQKCTLEFEKDNKIYKFETTSEFSMEKRSVVCTMDLTLPEQRIKAFAQGSSEHDSEISFNANTYWDADNDATKKIDIDIKCEEILDKTALRKMDITVNTPFKNHKLYKYNRVTEFVVSKEPKNNQDQEVLFGFKDDYQLIMGTADKEYSYKFWSFIPKSHNRVEMRYSVVTPYENLKNFFFDIKHKHDGIKYLSSSVKVGHNDNDLALSLSLANSGNKFNNKLNSSILFTSSNPALKIVNLRLTHSDDGRVYASEAFCDFNGQVYTAKLDATYFRIHYQVQIDSEVRISLPDGLPISVKFIHANTLTNLNTTVSAYQDIEKNMKLNIAAKGSKAEKDYAIEINIYNSNRYSYKNKYTYNHMNGIEYTHFIQINNDPRYTEVQTFRYRSTELFFKHDKYQQKTLLDVKFQNYPYTLLLEIFEGENMLDKIIMDGSVDKTNSGWSADASLATTSNEMKKIDFNGDLKQVKPSVWNLDGQISMNVRQNIKLSASLDVKDWTHMNAEINTPYPAMNKFGLGFTRDKKGNKKMFNSHIEVQPVLKKITVEHTYTMNPKFDSRLLVTLPDTDFKYIEILADHSFQRRGGRSNMKIKYSPDKEIEVNFKGRGLNMKKFPENTKLTLDVKTPFSDFSSMNIKTEIDKKDNKWLGKLDVESSLKNFQSLDVDFEKSQTETSFDSDLTISSSAFETVATAVHLDWGKKSAMNLTLQAPEIGRTVIGYKRHFSSWLDFENKVFAELNGQNLDLDVGLKHNEEVSKTWLTFEHPGSKDSFMKFYIYKNNENVESLDAGAFLKIGKKSKPYDFSVQLSPFNQKKPTWTNLALGVTFETPFTKPVSYLFKAVKNARNDYGLIIYVKQESVLIDVKYHFKSRDGSTESNFAADYKINEDGNKFGSVLNVQNTNWIPDSIKLMSYYNDEQITIDWTQKILGTKFPLKVNIDLDVSTPFDQFRDIGSSTSLIILENSIESSSIVEYLDDQEALVTVHCFYEKPDSLTSMVRANGLIQTPLSGYEKNVFNYTHTVKANSLLAKLKAVTGKGHTVIGDLKLDESELVLNANGPVEYFESLTITSKFSKPEKRVYGDAQLKSALTEGPLISEYDVQFENGVLTADFKLRTPLKKDPKADFHFTHKKLGLNKHTTTAKLTWGENERVTSNLFWNFDSFRNMESKLILSSSFDKFENALFELNTKQQKELQKVHTGLEWDLNKVIASDAEWSLDVRDDKSNIAATISIETPFQNVKNSKVKLQHTAEGQTFYEEFLIQHNDRVLLDTDFDYSFGAVHEGHIEIRSPKPMAFTFKGKSDDTFHGELDLNWDKNSPGGHMKLKTDFADRSEGSTIERQLVFTADHPARVMGLNYHYKISDSDTQSSGSISWDKNAGQTILYDTGVQILKGKAHLKIGVPNHSVKMLGYHRQLSMGNTMAGGEFQWDADRDESKKIVLAAGRERKAESNKYDLTVELPSINQKMNMNIRNQKSYDASILDSQMELSYSSDPSKTLTMNVKIDDSERDSRYPEKHNYTAEVRLSHPVTNTNIQWVSHCGKVEHLSSIGGRLEYMTNEKVKDLFQLWSQYNKNTNNFDIQVSMPQKNIGLNGKLSPSTIRPSLKVQSFEDGKEALKFQIKFDHRKRNMDLLFNYDQDDTSKLLTMSGRYVNNSALQFLVTSHKGQQTVAESMVAVRLNTSKVLHTKILWRPEIFSEVQTFWGIKLTEFSYAANNAFKESVKSVGTEVEAKYLRFSQELGTEMGTLFQFMQDEMDQFSVELEGFRTQFRRFYRRNDLNVREMGEQMRAVFDKLAHNIRQLVKSYRQYLTGMAKDTDEWINQLKAYPINKMYSQTVKDVTDGLKEFRKLLEETLNEVAIELDKFSQISYRTYLRISRTIDRKLNSYTHSLGELPKYKKMLQQKLEESRTNIPMTMKLYDEAYVAVQQMLQDQFHDMMSRNEFKYIHSVLSEMNQQIKHWQLHPTVQTAFKRVIDTTKNLFLMELSQLKQSWLNFQRSKLIVYDPARGVLQFEIHLPVPLKSLAEPPKLSLDKYIRRFKAMSNMQIPSANFSVWDKFYENVPSLEPSSWMPPFQASGYIINSQNIFTFDGAHYKFLSACSHVLVRDMLEDAFSVVVNYDRSPKVNGIKSLCLNIKNLGTLEIFDDYKVTMNGQETEMPIIYNGITVVRQGDFIIAMYDGGLEVHSNPKLNHHKVTLDGWYHGRTAGLLGSYDNEISNDIANERMIANMEVNSRSCKKQNLAVTSDPRLDKNSVCQKAFEQSTSKFRPCFKRIDPSPFVEMCQIAMTSMDEDRAIYQTTEQYRHVCEEKGIFIGTLKEYVPCEAKDPFEVNSKDDLYQSADVVFVVNDALCNSWISPMLSNLVSQMDRSLSNSGKKNNRFGLLTYDGSDTSVRTIHGNHFGEALYFLKAAETVRFVKTGARGNFATNVENALRYPFRAGVAKVLVVAPCSSCEVGLFDRQLGASLLKEGIQVHILNGDSLAASASMDQTSFAYCRALAKTTLGIVKEDLHYMEKKARTQNKFIKTFARDFAEQVRLPLCQTCECNIETARTECKVCSSYSSPSLPNWLSFEMPRAMRALHEVEYQAKKIKVYFD